MLLNGTETAVLPIDISLGDKLTALVESIWVEGVTGENLQGIHSPPAPAGLPSPSSSVQMFFSDP